MLVERIYFILLPPPPPPPPDPASFQDDEDDDDDGLFDGFGYSDPDEQVGRGPPKHGVIALDASAQAAVEAAIAAALATDAHRVVQMEDKEDAASTTAALERINALLRLAGEAEPDALSRCIRAGLARDAFGEPFTGTAAELDAPVAWLQRRECVGSCDGQLTVPTLRELLRQRDYAGMDYEDGAQRAIVKCSQCDHGAYVTHACRGMPDLDSGKFHNHCRQCPGLGVCISDYRNKHCNACGRHPFVGSMGAFKCVCHPLQQAIKRARAGDRAALAALYHQKMVFDIAIGGDDDDDDDGIW
jgi:hypothetical protein